MPTAATRTSGQSKQKTLIAAAGYIRMSTAAQEASPKRQREEISQLAEREGYRIAFWYTDEALTGTESLNRPEFQKMLADARKGKFRAVLMYEQSRMSREDAFDALAHWKVLRDAKVEMLTCQRGRIDLNSLGGFITAIVDQHGAHDESLKIADRMVSGCLHLIRKGKRASGSAIFGFDKQIKDEQGRVVRRVHASEKFRRPKSWTCELVPTADVPTIDGIVSAFEQARAGEALQCIAIDLNQRGLRTPGGRKFDHQSVKRMLSNPVYAGVLRAGFHSSGKFRRINEEGVQYVPNSHVGIVTEELFHDVQAKLKALGHHKRPTTVGRYLLSGLMICDHCGTPMYGKVYYIKRTGEQRLSYCCSRSIAEGREHCDGPNVGAELMERFVLKVVREKLLSEDNQQALLESAKRWHAQKRHSFEQEQLDEIRMKIERGTENLALAGGDDFRAIQTLLERWRADEKKLVERIGEQERKNATPSDALQNVYLLAEMRDHLEALDRTILSAALRGTIREIRARSRFVETGKKRTRLLSGVIHFHANVCADGAIPFTDGEVNADRRWWEVVRFVRAVGKPLTVREISEALGYAHDVGAEGHVYKAIAAGELMKNPNGRGFVAVRR